MSTRPAQFNDFAFLFQVIKGLCITSGHQYTHNLILHIDDNSTNSDEVWQEAMKSQKLGISQVLV